VATIPAGGRGWSPNSRLAVLAVGNFVVAINIHILAGLLNEVSGSLGVTVQQAGLMIAAASAMTCVAAPLCATWGSGLDRRYLLGGSLLVCAVASLLAALSQTYAQLLSTRLLGALTSAIFLPQAAATVVLMVAEHRRAQALSLVLMGVGGGLVLGVPAGVLIGTAYGWRTAMACLALAALVLALMSWRALPAGLKVARLNLSSWRSVFTSPPLLLLLMATALMSMANAGAGSYLAPMTAALPRADAHTVSAMFLVHGIAWVAGTAVPALLAHRIEAHRLAAGAALAVLASFLLRPFVTDWLPPAYAVQALWALGASCFFAVQQPRVVGIAPALSSASIALSSSLNYLGFALGTLFGAAVWGWTGGRYLTWAMAWMPLAVIVFSVVAERASRCRFEPAAALSSS